MTTENTEVRAFMTQPWGASNSLLTRSYTVHRITFTSHDLTLVGNLFVPHVNRPAPAVVIVGPVAFVKEQAPLQYATRLAALGCAALIFDPRYHGESEGVPRRYESPLAKTEDISAAVSFLAAHIEVDANQISVVGICQGVNWAIEATRLDQRVKSICLVAGHYLMPEVAKMYLGGQEKVDERLAKSLAATGCFEESGQTEYIPIVSSSFTDNDSEALLSAEFIQSFYIRWADRHPMLSHRGLWENRITAMSEHLIWGHRIDLSVCDLHIPTLMIHADRAASGPNIPRELFAKIPSINKSLVWLGLQGQIQFYEDPITIDLAVQHIVDFFAADKSQPS